MIINLIVTVNTYMIAPNIRNILDIVGTSVVCIANYNYHKKAALVISNNRPLNFIADDTMYLLLYDFGAIHISMVLKVINNFVGCCPNVILLSSIFHLLCYIGNISHLFYVKKTKREAIYHTENGDFFIFIQFCFTCVPNFFDIIFIIAHSNGSPYSLDAIYVLYIIGIIFYTKPLYELNHIALHFCIIAHSYQGAHCNMYIIQNEK